MAVDNICSPDNNYITSVSSFECSLKKKLKWNKAMWNEAGEQGSRIQKLCNSMNYWKKSLKPAIADNVIVITLFDNDKDVRNDLFKVIEEIDKIAIVKGITQFRNPRYLAVHFESKIQADCVRDNFRMLENAFVVYLAWALDAGPEKNTLKIHWIPMSVDIGIIKKALEKYVACIEETRSVLTLMSGRDVPLGKVTFKVTLNQGITQENIPHLLNIADMEALVTMPGRVPMCLNCNLLGHISRECKQRYCKTCNVLKDKSHQCLMNNEKVSYAAALKEGAIEIDPDDWGAAFLPLADKTKLQEHDRLSNKINGLELQIAQIQKEERKAMELNLDKDATVYGNFVAPVVERKKEIAVDLVEAGFNSAASHVGAMDMSADEEKLNTLSVQSQGEILTKNNNSCVLEKGRLGKSVALVKEVRAKLSKVKVNPELATYGKPNINNARKLKEAAKRLKEDAKFDAMNPPQSFLFSD